MEPKKKKKAKFTDTENRLLGFQRQGVGGLEN